MTEKGCKNMLIQTERIMNQVHLLQAEAWCTLLLLSIKAFFSPCFREMVGVICFSHQWHMDENPFCLFACHFQRSVLTRDLNKGRQLQKKVKLSKNRTFDDFKLVALLVTKLILDVVSVQGCLYEGQPRLQVVPHHQQTSEDSLLSTSEQPSQKSLDLPFQLH